MTHSNEPFEESASPAKRSVQHRMKRDNGVIVNPGDRPDMNALITKEPMSARKKTNYPLNNSLGMNNTLKHDVKPAARGYIANSGSDMVSLK